jgi:hypothetical protein
MAPRKRSTFDEGASSSGLRKKKGPAAAAAAAAAGEAYKQQVDALWRQQRGKTDVEAIECCLQAYATSAHLVSPDERSYTGPNLVGEPGKVLRQVSQTLLDLYLAKLELTRYDVFEKEGGMDLVNKAFGPESATNFVMTNGKISMVCTKYNGMQNLPGQEMALPLRKETKKGMPDDFLKEFIWNLLHLGLRTPESIRAFLANPGLGRVYMLAEAEVDALIANGQHEAFLLKDDAELLKLLEDVTEMTKIILGLAPRVQTPPEEPEEEAEDPVDPEDSEETEDSESREENSDVSVCA